jgi:hypothetical protein
VKPTGVGSFEALTLEALTLARRTYTRRGMRSSGQRIRDQIAELIAGLITLRVTISSSDDLRPGDQRHHLALAAGEDTRSPNRKSTVIGQGGSARRNASGAGL